MSLDEAKWKKYDEQYREAGECIRQSNSMKDALPCYEYLYKLKPYIPKELYAYHFRELLNMNTANVPNELRLKMFEGVDPEDIMYQDELDAINNDFDNRFASNNALSHSYYFNHSCGQLHKRSIIFDYYLCYDVE